MRKRDELTDPNSCMSRARDDEWTFVLLERDISAPATVLDWAKRRVRLGKNRRADPQIVEAVTWADGRLDEMNVRRLALAERHSRGELAPPEVADFKILQEAYFEGLKSSLEWHGKGKG